MLKACIICGTGFEAGHVRHTTCSRTCFFKRKNKYERERRASKLRRPLAHHESLHRSCVVCGTEFEAKDPRHVTCSKPCSVKRKNELKCERRRLRNGWQKRDAAPTEVQQRRQQGLQHYHSGTRHAPTPTHVIVAAARRGWTTAQIAFAAGVSYQAITQRLLKYEQKHGKIILVKPPKQKRYGVKVSWCCAQCGKASWSSGARPDRIYCSDECWEAAIRLITDEMAETAIRLRLDGETWSLISNQIGFPIQSVQLRIWKYLFEQGRLTRATVDPVWFSKDGWHRAGYAWLEKNTGLIPLEGGTQQTARPYRNSQSAWRGLKETAPPHLRVRPL